MKLSPTKARYAQRGAAIVMAMLVVMLAATVVSSLFWREHVALRSVENRSALAQTRWIERVVLDWTRVVLRVDGLSSGPVDHLEELWANPIADTRLDESVTGGSKLGDGTRAATLSGQVFDAQGRFNLTNLASENSVRQQAAARKLFESLGLPGQLVEALTVYLRKTRDTVAEGKVVPASELPLLRSADLRAVTGFDEATIRALDAYVILLPTAAATNINTADPLVIAALVEGLDSAGARRFVAQSRRRFTTLGAAQTELGGNLTLNSELLTVSSNYFLVRGLVRYDRVEAQTETLMNRQGNKVNIVWQQRF
jgi:general secretion pathway protein K